MPSVAVVGLAGRFPGARDVDELWSHLVAGRELLRRFTPEEAAADGVDPAEYDHPDYVPVHGALEEIDLFDAGLFGYSPGEAEIIDPQQRLLLQCAWAALETAGYAGRGGRVGVFAGTSMSTYLLRHVLAASSARHIVSLPVLLGNDKDHAATRIAYHLGLSGPALAVQTACSTSLVAVHLAVRSLLAGECDLALAGGASVQLPQRAGYVHERHGINAPDGHCRAFDERAAGTVPGSGVGLVVLKRADDAWRDRDTVHALIRGSAINNDASAKVGYTAPSVQGQADVVRAALDAAGVGAGDIGYVEAHGTGTELGDGIEIAALTAAYRDSTDRTGYCGIGSVKPNVGHLDAASGVTGLIKAVLALSREVVPPSINCERPHPKLELAATPFYVTTTARPWPRTPGAPRRCGVSSFGMGGTNAHVVLEEAPPRPDADPEPADRPVLVVQSGRTRQTVEALGRAVVDALDAPGAPRLDDAAYTLRTGRAPLPVRRAVTVSSAAELRERLEHVPVREVPRRVSPVFLFPGQGSQYAAMAAPLYAGFPAFRTAVDECVALLDARLGAELTGLLCVPDPAPDTALALTGTRLAQPALFVVEYALSRLLMGWGLRPRALIGHSVGEFTAACVAGALPLPDALALVAERGRLMSASPGGAMLGVLADAETVRGHLVGLEDTVSIAAVNAPGAVVISGARDSVRQAAERFAAVPLRTKPLRVSHAFHSPLVEPVAEEFRRRAAAVTYGRLSTPVVSNVTGDFVDRRNGYSAEYWARHLREPVRFSAGVARILTLPNPVLIEVGPGRSLISLAAQHPAADGVAGAATMPSSNGPSDTAVRALLDAVGTAWAAGAPVDWDAFTADLPRRRVPLPTYPFARDRHWLDAPGANPAPPTADDGARVPAAGVQPRLAEIWRRLLGVETLGPESDFFHLGGHSLLAVPLLSGIKETFGVAVSLSEAQRTSSLGAQAELVSVRMRDASGSPPQEENGQA